MEFHEPLTDPGQPLTDPSMEGALTWGNQGGRPPSQFAPAPNTTLRCLLASSPHPKWQHLSRGTPGHQARIRKSPQPLLPMQGLANWKRVSAGSLDGCGPVSRHTAWPACRGRCPSHHSPLGLASVCSKQLHTAQH